MDHFNPDTPNDNLPVARHIISHDDPTATLTPLILEVINRDPEPRETTEYRKNGETFWIHRMKTIIPFGLNKLK